jgi:hypothetical protein
MLTIVDIYIYICCASVGLNNKLFDHLLLVLSTVQVRVLAEYCAFLSICFRVFSLMFINIWCGKIGLEETIIKEIEQDHLTWYGHVQRMAEGRLPKITLKWMPKQKRARRKKKKNWEEGIRKAMNERNLNEGQWEDRKQGSLCFVKHRKTF